MIHLVPSQRSARVWFWLVPTITQAAGVQDTPTGRGHALR
jgi:hypothetical protein